MATTIGAVRASGRQGFYRFASDHRDRTALIIPGGATMTFGCLLDRVNALSHGLRGLGLTRGDVVAAAVRNGFEYIELFLATAQVGMYFVPIDWRLGHRETFHIVHDSDATVLIAEAERVAGWSADALPDRLFVCGGTVEGWRPYESLIADQPVCSPEDRSAGSLIGYTAGITGRLKGVKWYLPSTRPEQVITRHLMPVFAAYGAEVGRGVHLVCSPLYHSAPGAFAIGLLHFGHTLVIQSSFDAEAFLRDVDRYRVTSSHMVPTHFHRLLRLADVACAEYDLASLEFLIHGSAPCPILIKQKMLDWLGPIVWEYFGCNEGWVSRISPHEWVGRPGSVGKALPDLTVAIVDDAGDIMPPGMPGTIYFGSDEHRPVFEYQNDPDRTAAGRLGNLVTGGDYGYVSEDGYIYLLDRHADVIVSGDVRIYPAEIEQYLMLHPAVSDAAVVAIPDAIPGRRVLAVIQLSTTSGPSWVVEKELHEYCDDALAATKRPERFGFLTDFPRTDTGKLRRNKIREIFADVQFMTSVPLEGREYSGHGMSWPDGKY
ncbi:AMP-binding protein [Nocardia sp. NBC_01377]|uniref:AMP-binding protein n=1 Tax=Nocardia sp. NBC_01377 TaxID=2903595 RepID=UPI0032568498